MRFFIGIGIIVGSILIFGWWGLLSLIIALPFIGWQDRHKGPFPTNQRVTTDYRKGNILGSEIPISFRSIQNLLVKIGKESLNSSDLHIELHVLVGTLRIEKYAVSNLTDKQVLLQVMQDFSSAFPNWQKEYSIINEAINHEFE
tara:strand:- start:811 stop:1242 length:432 start_codon:yes stop_codon:yes gene_type:complete